MPVSRYDHDYSPKGKKGAASKALQAMRSHYGLTEGTRIFYAKAEANRKRRGRP